MIKIRKEKSCGAIIVNNNKVLVIVQKESGNYGFPKGHMEYMENEVETAIREIKEETGLDILVDEIKRFSLSYEQEVKEEKIIKEVVYFISKLKENTNITLQAKEISNYIWLDIDKVYDTLTYYNIKKIWLKAKENI